jgi:hypothetical protein
MSIDPDRASSTTESVISMMIDSVLKFSGAMLITLSANVSSAPVYFDFVSTKPAPVSDYVRSSFSVSVPDSVWTAAQTSSQTFGVYSATIQERFFGDPRRGITLGALSPDVSVTLAVNGVISNGVENYSALCDLPNSYPQCWVTFDSPNISTARMDGNLPRITYTLTRSIASSITLDGNVLAVNRYVDQYNIFDSYMRFDLQTGLTTWKIQDSGEGEGYWSVRASSIPVVNGVPLPATFGLLLLPLGLLVFHRNP